MVTQWITAIGFVVLALLCVRFAVQKPGPTAYFALITFLAIADVAVLGVLHPNDLQNPNPLPELITKSLITVSLVFPWSLYRFSRTLAPRSKRWTGFIADAFLAILVIWTFTIQNFNSISGIKSLPPAMAVFALLMLAELLLLPGIAATKLMLNSRSQPGVVRSRMRVLALASASLTLALLVSFVASGQEPPSEVIKNAAAALALLSVLLFIIGLSPPAFIRTVWGQESRNAMSLAAADAMQMSNSTLITQRLLETMAATAGTSRAAFFPVQGDPIIIGLTASELAALHQGSDVERLEFQISAGKVELWTSALWPFIENDEQIVLTNGASLIDLSLKRHLTEECRRQVEVAQAIEQTLRDEAEQRERIIAERTAQLQQSNDDLRQFAYAASHDLQAPLRTVSGFTEVLFASIEPQSLSDEQKMMVGHIQDGVGKMQHLIQDLLSYGRIGSSASRATRVSLEIVAQDVEKMLDNDVKVSGAVITIQAPNWVLADEGHVRQLLQNLAQNSIAHSVPDRAPRISISSHDTDGGMVEVRVSDNGQGISPENFQRVFEMFKTLKSGPGTGMGLALVKRIVERYGGEIHIESEPGSGASFIFTLPRANPVRPNNGSTQQP